MQPLKNIVAMVVITIFTICSGTALAGNADTTELLQALIQVESVGNDRATSMWVCQKYLGLYATQQRLGKEPAYEDMARIWNGGPNGWKSKGTIAYWSKVNRQLQKIEIAKARSQATPTAVAKAKPPNLSGITLAVVVKR